MTSLLESVLDGPLRRTDRKILRIARRPIPRRPREIMEIIAALGPTASKEAMRRGIDLRDTDPRDLYFAVLGRWPTPAELAQHGPDYEPWPHLCDMLMSEEFRRPLVRRVLDAYPEKRRLLFVRIARSAGAHAESAMISQHPTVPVDFNPPDFGAFVRTLGPLFHRFPRARTVGVTHTHLSHFIRHEPHFAEPDDPLGWRYTAAPYRAGDLLFALIRPPQDIILSQVNAILTGLLKTPKQPQLKSWQQRLGTLPRPDDKPGWRDAGRVVLAHLELHNPICSALADGTAEAAIEICRAMPISLVGWDKYEIWLQSAIEVFPAAPSNVSLPLLTANHLNDADRHHLAALITEDATFHSRFATRLAALDGTEVPGYRL